MYYNKKNLRYPTIESCKFKMTSHNKLSHREHLSHWCRGGVDFLGRSHKIEEGCKKYLNLFVSKVHYQDHVFQGKELILNMYLKCNFGVKLAIKTVSEDSPNKHIMLLVEDHDLMKEHFKVETQ